MDEVEEYFLGGPIVAPRKRVSNLIFGRRLLLITFQCSSLKVAILAGRFEIVDLLLQDKRLAISDQ